MNHIEYQCSSDIVGDEYFCLMCGYTKKLPKEYPERGKALSKAGKHECVKMVKPFGKDALFQKKED